MVVGRHPDACVAHPLGAKGVVLGQGDTCEATAADLKSALAFHLETFAHDSLDFDRSILEAFVAETGGGVRGAVSPGPLVWRCGGRAGCWVWPLDVDICG